MQASRKFSNRQNLLCFVLFLAAPTCDVVDSLLLLLHAGDVIFEAGHLVAALGGVVAQQVGQLGAVLAVLVYACWQGRATYFKGLQYIQACGGWSARAPQY